MGSYSISYPTDAPCQPPSRALLLVGVCSCRGFSGVLVTFPPIGGICSGLESQESSVFPCPIYCLQRATPQWSPKGKPKTFWWSWNRVAYPTSIPGTPSPKPLPTTAVRLSPYQQKFLAFNSPNF